MGAESILAFLGGTVLAGGVVSAIAAWVFKTYSAKWLDARFAERLQSARAQLDKEIHRAQKLADREFDVVSEGWLKLRELYDYCVESYQYGGFYDFDEMRGDDINDVLNDLGFTAQEKRAVKAADEPCDECRRIEDYRRLTKYKDAHREFESFIGAHGVFMPSEISERFLALSPLIGVTFQDFASGIQDGLQAVGSQGKLAMVGVPIMRELETLIRARLWSAAEPA